MHRVLVLALTVTASLAACPLPVECPPGEVADDAGVCAACPAGTFATRGVCAPCPPDQVSSAGDSACELCPAGTAPSVDRDECFPCSLGEFAPAGSIECLVCPFGTVAGQQGAAQCDPCGDGFLTNAARSACEPCPEGTFGRDGTCTTCPPDQVSSGGGDDTCDPCPAGTPACVDRDECFPCSVGEFAPAGSIECLVCPFGTVAGQQGTAQCDPCGDGFFANAARSACEPCPEGTFGRGGTCTTCPPDQVSSGGGDDTCDPCPAGTAPSVDRDECFPCSLGEFAPAGSIECLVCPFGTVATEAGSEICEPCPSGLVPNPGRFACIECPTGQYAVDGTCVRCPAGTVVDATKTSCEACDAGTAPNATRDACEPCAAGTFAPDAWFEACLACPAGTVSPPGALACTACPSGQVPAADGATCVDPAPLPDVDAPCTLDPIAVQELTTSTTDVLYDGERDVFLTAQQTPGIERVDPTTFAVTRFADAPEAMGRVFRFRDRVLAVRLIDFVRDPDLIVDAPLDLTDPTGATIHPLRDIPGVGPGQVMVRGIVPVGATGLAYLDTGTGIVTLLDTATTPFTFRFSTVPSSRFLIDLAGTGAVTVLAMANLNATFTVTAFDGTTDAPWLDGFQTSIVTHTLSGAVQTLLYDETHEVVYATTLPGADPDSVYGLMMIDIGNPAAPIRRQAVEPDFPRRNGPLSRPVFVEDFVVVVNQDINDHARATVFERGTLRRIGFLVDENYAPEGASTLFSAATPTAARGSKVFVGSGVGLVRDFVFDVGPCVAP